MDMNGQSFIYCSQCGTKSVSAAKFCSTCGNKMQSFSSMANDLRAPVVKKPVVNVVSDTEYDEEGIPTSFKKPSKLHYEIENSIKNKFSGEEIFKSSPSEDKSKRNKLSNYKKLSKEEFLSQSIKECASRKPQDIDES